MQPKSASTRPALCALLVVLGLAACGGSLPSLPRVGADPAAPEAASGQLQVRSRERPLAETGPTSPQPLPPEPAGKRTASASPCTSCKIVAFRSPIVTLFMNEQGQEGQRVPHSTLPLPMIATVSTTGGARLQIMTLDGPRWVLLTDIELERPN